MPVKVVTDSTADIPPDKLRELDITVVPLNVHFGDEVYQDRVNLSEAEFFAKLATSPVHPTTSQPSVGQFVEAYRKLAAAGADGIVSIHISSKLSGTCNSAELAAREVAAEIPVIVVDSLSSSLAQGIPTMAAARAAAEGKSLEEVAEVARSVIPKMRVCFVVDTLEYLRRGGRINRAAAFLGSLLNIKPILTVENGEIVPLERVRTRKKALAWINDFVHSFPEIVEMGIMHFDADEDVEWLLNAIADHVPREKIFISLCSAVLGVHVGPKILAVGVRIP